MSRTISFYLSQHGIFHQTTYLGTIGKNRVAKKKKHLHEITRGLLFYKHVHKVLWADAH